MKTNRKTRQKSLWKHPDTYCTMCDVALSWDCESETYEPFFCRMTSSRFHTLASEKRSSRFVGETGGPSR